MKFSIEELVTSKKWKTFMKYLYGWGAAVVILGALFKILHLKGATVMLFAGMGTEAVIFFFSAFEPSPEEYDWALVFPELSGMTEEEEIKGFNKGRRRNGLSPEELQEVLVNVLPTISFSSSAPAEMARPATVAPAPVAAPAPAVAPAAAHSGHSGSSGAIVFTEKFNKMLETAEIGPELFEKVGAGLRKLGEASGKIADISTATVATKDFADKLTKASGTISTFNENYSQTGLELNESMGALKNSINKSSETFADVGSLLVDGINSSVSGLEKSLTGAGNQVAGRVVESGQNIAETLNGAGEKLVKTYSELAQAMIANTSLISSGSTSYTQQLEHLNKNMTALNTAHELHLNETTQRLKDAEKVYAGVDDMTKKLNVTVAETDKFVKAVQMLNNNVESLNTVYGNMLSAIGSMAK